MWISWDEARKIHKYRANDVGTELVGYSSDDEVLVPVQVLVPVMGKCSFIVGGREGIGSFLSKRDCSNSGFIVHNCLWDASYFY